MEFDELQKIWNEQKGETMYVIDQQALHNSVGRKKDAASKRINKVEIGLILINSIVVTILLVDAIVNKEGFWDYAGAGIMALTVVFLLFFRMKRKQKENTFDRSLIGELDHAIANSDSIIQITTMMISYYIIPIAIFSFSKMIYFDASLEKWLLTIGMFALAFFLVRWERKVCHIPRQRNLLSLKRKLMEE